MLNADPYTGMPFCSGQLQQLHLQGQALPEWPPVPLRDRYRMKAKRLCSALNEIE